MLIELSECSELRSIDFNPQVISVTPEEILKCIFIRGLAEARMRNPGSNLAQYIETFILVQVSPWQVGSDQQQYRPADLSKR